MFQLFPCTMLLSVSHLSTSSSAWTKSTFHYCRPSKMFHPSDMHFWARVILLVLLLTTFSVVRCTNVIDHDLCSGVCFTYLRLIDPCRSGNPAVTNTTTNRHITTNRHRTTNRHEYLQSYRSSFKPMFTSGGQFSFGVPCYIPCCLTCHSFNFSHDMSKQLHLTMFSVAWCADIVDHSLRSGACIIRSMSINPCQSVNPVTNTTTNGCECELLFKSMSSSGGHLRFCVPCSVTSHPTLLLPNFFHSVTSYDISKQWHIPEYLCVHSLFVMTECCHHTDINWIFFSSITSNVYNYSDNNNFACEGMRLILPCDCGITISITALKNTLITEQHILSCTACDYVTYSWLADFSLLSFHQCSYMLVPGYMYVHCLIAQVNLECYWSFFYRHDYLVKRDDLKFLLVFPDCSVVVNDNADMLRIFLKVLGFRESMFDFVDCLGSNGLKPYGEWSWQNKN